MKLTIGKKILIIVTLLLLTVSLFATVLATMPKSFAIWTTGGSSKLNSTPKITADIDSAWEKYLIYEKCADGYIVVGYEDGITNPELAIPSTIDPNAVTIINKNDETITPSTNNVIKVASSFNANGGLTYLIESIVIGSNVVEIEPYTFMMMENLKQVIFKNASAELVLGEYSFYGCPNLNNNSVITNREFANDLDVFGFDVTVEKQVG